MNKLTTERLNYLNQVREAYTKEILLPANDTSDGMYDRRTMKMAALVFPVDGDAPIDNYRRSLYLGTYRNGFI